jgi:hypothetical protein
MMDVGMAVADEDDNMLMVREEKAMAWDLARMEREAEQEWEWRRKIIPD